jgi:hypothetical protein
MKTTSTKIAAFGAAAGIVAVLLAMSGALSPVFAASQQASSTTSATPANAASIPGLAVGQTITITSTQGHYKVVGDKTVAGNASGTMTFTVTGKFAGGYSLSITSGSVDVNGTTYSVTSGSAEAGPYAAHIVGQGATASGAFLMKAAAHGTFGGEFATMSLDLQSGTTEYAIFLVGTIQG